MTGWQRQKYSQHLYDCHAALSGFMLILKFQIETGFILALYLRNRFLVKHFRVMRNFPSQAWDIERISLVEEETTELFLLVELWSRLV